MVTKRFAFDVFDGYVVLTISLTDFMNRQDIGMIESRGSFGFLHETTDAFGILGEFGGQQFERDFALEQSVLRKINLAHPARAKLRNEHVMRNSL